MLVAATENPFQLVELGDAISAAAEAVDMQGNKVMINGDPRRRDHDRIPSSSSMRYRAHGTRIRLFREPN